LIIYLCAIFSFIAFICSLETTMKTYLFITPCLLLIWIRNGDCLQNCYVCNSNDHPDCTEQFDHAWTDGILAPEECTVDAANYCIKTTGVYGGVVGTTRFCSSRDMGNQCQYINYPDHDRVYRGCIYTCSGSQCNSAWRSSTISSITLILPALIALLYSQV